MVSDTLEKQSEGKLRLDPRPSPSKEADDFRSPDEQRHLVETQSIRESNLDLRMNRKLRWKYARWVFCYLVSYSAFVGVLLIADGFQLLGFDLEEGVISFLVGSTAASAIGLVLAVTTGLFKPLK